MRFSGLEQCEYFIYVYMHKTPVGKGLDYMPGAASSAATHKGRLKNVRLSALRDGGHADPRACFLKLESDAKRYDNSMKENIGVNGNNFVAT